MSDSLSSVDRAALDVDFSGIPAEADIIRDWPKDLPPKLSIACLAYNHRPFIESALQGLLMQRTTFPFHIVCYDDCSTDGTREVLQAFGKWFPNIIQLILPETNQHSIGRRPYIDYMLPQLIGEYVTCCEGDDFWTDPLKLQKQVDFLEQNPDFVLATHDIQSIDQNGNVLSASYLPAFYKRHFSALELRLCWAGPVTQAMVYRNVLKDYPPEYWKGELGDQFQASLLGEYGASAYLDDVRPSMYRFHVGGIFSSLTEQQRWDRQADTFFWIYRYYQRTGKPLEARAFKLRLLEKHLRAIGWRDWLSLAAVRFLGANLKKSIDRLIRRERF